MTRKKKSEVKITNANIKQKLDAAVKERTKIIEIAKKYAQEIKKLSNRALRLEGVIISLKELLGKEEK